MNPLFIIRKIAPTTLLNVSGHEKTQTNCSIHIKARWHNKDEYSIVKQAIFHNQKCLKYRSTTLKEQEFLMYISCYLFSWQGLLLA